MVSRLRMRRAGALVPALVVAGVLTAVSGGYAQAQANEDAVIAWNANCRRGRNRRLLAPRTTRSTNRGSMPMTHLAIHDALNAIDRRSRPTRSATAKRGASPDAAVAAAARDVLVTLSATPCTLLADASTRRASRVSKPTTRPHSATSRTVGQDGRVSRWDRPPPRPSSP